MMILSDVFERFADTSPLPVMAQAILENALNPRVVDQLFEDVSERQYTRKLLFSSIVDLMSLVVCRIRPAIHAAYQAHAEIIDASLRAVYGKIDRVEPGIAAALVRSTAERLGPVIEAMNGGRPALLPGYRVKILDGNHLAGTEHRLKELRTMRSRCPAGAGPGRARPPLDAGHRRDPLRRRPCPGAVAAGPGPAVVHPRELWIEDRNFCTTDFLFGIAGACGVLRRPPACLDACTGNSWGSGGRAAGSTPARCSEQTIRAHQRRGRDPHPAADHGGPGPADAGRGHGDPPADQRPGPGRSRPGDRRSVPAALDDRDRLRRIGGDARRRGQHAWVTPRRRCSPSAWRLVAYNVLSTLKAALRSVHGEEVVAEQVSGYYVAEEVTMTHRGMMIAIPEDEWVEFQEMAPAELAGVLVKLAEAVRLPAYQKHPRGPKKPKPKKQSGAKIKHVSTAKILAGRQKCTT